MDNNKFAVGVFIGLQMAFGTVDHNIILKNVITMEAEVVC